MTLSLAFAALCAAPCAFALDTGDIVITSLKGEVHVVMGGSERAVRPGAVLELPATVRTGTDGAIELRQGATTVSVGPDTLLEFPALAQPGGPIDRIVQPRGSAFYSIGKRPGRKLRIETPYLVGVVKGTQFNVLAQDAATTISLFEGLLEIRSADESDVIDLHAGEIASRSRVDTDINVLKMGGDRAPAAPRAPVAPKPAPAEGKESSPPAPTPGPTRSAPVTRDDADSLYAAREAPDVRPPAPAAEANPVADAPADLSGGGNPVANVPATVGDSVSDIVAPTAPDTVAVIPPVAVPDTAGPVIDTADTVASAPTVEVGGAAAVELNVPTQAPAIDPGVMLGANSGAADVQIEVTPAPGAGVPASVAVAVAVDPVADAVTPAVDLGAGVVVAGNNVDLGVSVGVTDPPGLSLGLDDDNSGPGNTNHGENNGNGQGNDNSGPGNSGRENDDKSSVVDDVAGLLNGLRGKSGKK